MYNVKVCNKQTIILLQFHNKCIAINHENWFESLLIQKDCCGKIFSPEIKAAFWCHLYLNELSVIYNKLIAGTPVLRKSCKLVWFAREKEKWYFRNVYETDKCFNLVVFTQNLNISFYMG